MDTKAETIIIMEIGDDNTIPFKAEDLDELSDDVNEKKENAELDQAQRLYTGLIMQNHGRNLTKAGIIIGGIGILLDVIGGLFLGN